MFIILQRKQVKTWQIWREKDKQSHCITWYSCYLHNSQPWLTPIWCEKDEQLFYDRDCYFAVRLILPFWVIHTYSLYYWWLIQMFLVVKMLVVDRHQTLKLRRKMDVFFLIVYFRHRLLFAVICSETWTYVIVYNVIVSVTGVCFISTHLYTKLRK